MDGLRVTGRVTIPWRELSWRFSRSSGPGGQGVNTTDSRVELSWDVVRSTALSDTQRERVRDRLGGRMTGDVLTVVAAERRSQLHNRETAKSRLVALVADALRPPAAPRRRTRPSRSARLRRLEDKKRRGQTKRLRRPPSDGS